MYCSRLYFAHTVFGKHIHLLNHSDRGIQSLLETNCCAWGCELQESSTTKRKKTRTVWANTDREDEQQLFTEGIQMLYKPPPIRCQTKTTEEIQPRQPWLMVLSLEMKESSPEAGGCTTPRAARGGPSCIHSGSRHETADKSCSPAGRHQGCRKDDEGGAT